MTVSPVQPARDERAGRLPVTHDAMPGESQPRFGTGGKPGLGHPPGVAGSTRLRRAAWWCLGLWPVAFMVSLVVITVALPEPGVSHGAAMDALGISFFFATLLGPPAAALVLSCVDFRRTRVWRALAPSFTLLGLLLGWDALGAIDIMKGDVVRWWAFAPSVFVAVVIGAVMAWPRRQAKD